MLVGLVALGTPAGVAAAVASGLIALVALEVDSGPVGALVGSRPAPEEITRDVAALARAVGVAHVTTLYAPALGPLVERREQVTLLDDVAIGDTQMVSSEVPVVVAYSSPRPRVVVWGRVVSVLVAEGSTRVAPVARVWLARDLAATHGRGRRRWVVVLSWAALALGLLASSTRAWGGVAFFALAAGALGPLVVLPRVDQRLEQAADLAGARACGDGAGVALALALRVGTNASRAERIVRATALAANLDAVDRLRYEREVALALRAVDLLRDESAPHGAG